MHYLEVANSNILFLLVGLCILVVVVQSLLFIRKALKRGEELGMDNKVMKKAMTNSAIFTIVPSLPIIVMLLALSVPLGRYFPWLRLSVVGSAVYESMAANVAAVNMGLTDISDPAMTPSVFGVIIWVMTLGIVWGIVFNIFFMKRLDKISKQAKSKKNEFLPIFSAALFSGMLATLSTPYVANVKNVTGIVAFFASGIAVLLCQKISKSTNIKIISEFSLPIAMIVGMGAAIVQAGIA